MSFKEILQKNFRKNLRKYLSSFFSGVFCVAMFFIYSTMLLLEEVIESNDEYPMQMLFIMTAVCVAVFSIFFISYSQKSFIRNKKKELAVYMVIGMDERKARKMLFLEETMVAGAATLTGMLVGMVFSRYFQLAITSLLKLKDMGYRLSVWNFIITLLVFTIIYGSCFILSDKEIKREDISSMMKEFRKTENKPYKKSDTVKAFLGLFLSIFSVVFVLLTAGDITINTKLYVPVLFLFTGYSGLYLMIFYGGKAILHYFRKRKNYYRNMLPVSELDHRYRQNTKIIFILAILASLIVMLVGSPFALVNISDQIAEDSRKDLQYTTVNREEDEQIGQILAEKQSLSIEQRQITCCTLEDGTRKPVLPVSEYNQRMGTSLTVNKGELYHLIITWLPGTLGVEPGSQYVIPLQEKTVEYRVCASLKGGYEFNGLIPTESILLLSDTDYEDVKDNLVSLMVNTVTFQDGWKDTEGLVNKIITTLPEDAYVTSRIQAYRELINGYSTFYSFVVPCALCSLFQREASCISSSTTILMKISSSIRDYFSLESMTGRLKRQSV